MRVDLHCHTTASDGELRPAALLAMQAAAGTALLAVTDHDTLAGWGALQQAAAARADGPRLIPGIEFSAADGKREVHVVGLNFDPGDSLLAAAVSAQQDRRRERAARIADRLDYLGIPGALDGACAQAEGALPGRVHFARFLVGSGRVTDLETAFRRYLGTGKPAAVPLCWPAMEEVVSWIRAAGGRAVLAHPLAYELGRGRLRELARRFAACGGEAVEVALPNIAPDQLRVAADLARHCALLASAGSDFHSPAQFWRLPSKVPSLPADLKPVWHDWI